MPPTPRGRTCDRPNSRSSTTADRASDDCAAYRAASRRTLRQRIRQGNYRDQRQEKQQRENPMHRVLLKTFDFSRLRAELLTGQKRDSTKCVAVSLSTSCQATNNPVRAVIECNDDVASVNAPLCQVAHDGC
jgi:hypothetical protein